MRYDLDIDSGVRYPPTSYAEVAAVAEDSGFDAVWKGESNSQDPLVALAAIATGTRTIKLGTAAYNIFGRSPVTLGIQAATLNDLSEGRLLLGLAPANHTIAAWHGASFDRPVRRLREYSDVVRLVARGERVDYAGEMYTVPQFKLSWRPSHPEVPQYFAAMGEQMAKLAGRHADGMMVNMATPAKVREVFDRVRQAAVDAGRDPSSLEYIAKVRVCIHPEPEVARDRLRQVVAFYAIAEFYRDLLDQMGFAEQGARVREVYEADGFRAAQQAVPDELVDGLPTVAARSSEEALERVQPYLDAGVTRLIIPFIPATDDAVGETKGFLKSWRV